MLARERQSFEPGDAMVPFQRRVEMNRGRYLGAASVLELAGVVVALERRRAAKAEPKAR
jgi:hypothetical protein